MFAHPEDLDAEDVARAVAEGWGIALHELTHVPAGFGSHHWQTGEWFVTVDSLSEPGKLAALTAAFGTAIDLAGAGLEFVVAPVPTRDGAPVRAIDDRYSVAVFPFVAGESAPPGPYRVDAERRAVRDLVARLHDATTAAVRAGREDFVIPYRPDLEAALDDLDTTWDAGPFSAQCRDTLRPSAAVLRDALAQYDALVEEVRGAQPWVVTHGEPKANNVLRTANGLRIIDWDTVLLAPPERDLWMLEPELDTPGTRLYARRWALNDIAITVAWFSGPHPVNADTQLAMSGLAPTIAQLT